VMHSEVSKWSRVVDICKTQPKLFYLIPALNFSLPSIDSLDKWALACGFLGFDSNRFDVYFLLDFPVPKDSMINLACALNDLSYDDKIPKLFLEIEKADEDWICQKLTQSASDESCADKIMRYAVCAEFYSAIGELQSFQSPRVVIFARAYLAILARCINRMIPAQSDRAMALASFAHIATQLRQVSAILGLFFL